MMKLRVTIPLISWKVDIALLKLHYLLKAHLYCILIRSVQYLL